MIARTRRILLAAVVLAALPRDASGLAREKTTYNWMSL